MAWFDADPRAAQENALRSIKDPSARRAAANALIIQETNQGGDPSWIGALLAEEEASPQEPSPFERGAQKVGDAVIGAGKFIANEVDRGVTLDIPEWLLDKAGRIANTKELDDEKRWLVENAIRRGKAEPAAPVPEIAPQQTRSTDPADFAKAGKAGVANLARSIAGLAQNIPGKLPRRLATDAVNFWGDVAADQQSGMSYDPGAFNLEAQRRANEFAARKRETGVEPSWAESLVGNLLSRGEMAIEDPRTAAVEATRDLPSTLGTALSVTPVGKASKAIAAQTVGAGLEAGSTSSDIYDTLNSAPMEEWAKVPDFQELSKVMPPEQAKDQIIQSIQQMITAGTLPAYFLTQKLTGAGAFEGGLFGALKKGGIKGIAKEALHGVKAEAPAEGVEGVIGQASTNIAEKLTTDPDQPVMEGTAEAGAAGAISGGIVGGVTGAGRGVANFASRKEAVDTALNGQDIGIDPADQAELIGLAAVARGQVADPSQVQDLINQGYAGVANGQVRIFPSGVKRLKAITDPLLKPVVSGEAAPEAIESVALRGDRTATPDLPIVDSPTPEPDNTIAAQLRAFSEGRKPAVLFTPGETLPTELPPNSLLEELPDGKGSLLYRDPEVLQLAKAGRVGEALGYGISQKPATDTVVTARDESGTVVQDVATDGSQAVAQAAATVAGPEGSVEERPITDALAEREVTNAIQEQATGESLLGQEGPEVGLPEVQAGQAQGQEEVLGSIAEPDALLDVSVPADVKRANAKDIATRMASSAQDVGLRPVAAKIADYIDKVPVTFVGKGGVPISSAPGPVSSLFARSPSTGGIAYREPKGGVSLWVRSSSEETTLHEMLHAATMIQLNKSPEIRAELNQMADLVIRAAEKHLPARIVGFMKHPAVMGGHFKADELLAYGYTSNTFRNFLSRLDYEGNLISTAAAMEVPTLWDRFVDIVRRLLGFERKDTDTLSMLIDKPSVTAAMGGHRFYDRMDKALDRLLKEQTPGQNAPKGYKMELKDAPFKPTAAPTPPVEQPKEPDKPKPAPMPPDTPKVPDETDDIESEIPKTVIEFDDGGLADRIQLKAVDRFHDLYRYQKKTGSTDDALDAYGLLDLAHGKVRKDIEDTENYEIIPLINAIKDTGYNYEEFVEFLKARHAPEANADAPGSIPMTDAEASAIVEKMLKGKRGKRVLEAERQFREFMDRTLAIAKNSGLLSQDTLDALANKFKNYIPLHRKGFEDRYSKHAGEIHERQGSSREIVDPIAQAYATREQTIVAAQQNLARQALYRLAEKYPSKTMRAAKQDYKVDNTAGIPMKVSKRVHPNSLTVRFDGEPRYVEFNVEDETGKRMLEELRKANPHGATGMFWKSAQIASRMVSYASVLLNPEFLFTNFPADLQAAIAAAGMDQIGRIEFTSRVFAAIPKLAAYKTGISTSGAAERYFDAGAGSGYVSMFKTQKDAEKRLNRLKDPGPLQGFRILADAVIGVQDVFQNAISMAAYETALSRGMSEHDAALIGKNIIINPDKAPLSNYLTFLYPFYRTTSSGIQSVFRKAKKDPVGFLVKAGGTLAVTEYMLSIFSRALSDEDDDGVKFSDKIAPETKRNYWTLSIPKDFKVPGWMENFVASFEEGEGRYLKIRKPLGPLNIFPELGRLVADYQAYERGDLKEWDVGDRATGMVATFFGGLSPVTGTGLVDIAAPAITDPFIQLLSNKDALERQIYSKKDEGVPKYLEPKSGTSDLAISISKKLNELGGGDEVTGAKFAPLGVEIMNIAPEVMDFAVGYLAGGLGRFITGSYKTVNDLANDVPIELKDTPFIRKLAGQHYDSIDAAHFRDEYKELGRVEKSLKRAAVAIDEAKGVSAKAEAKAHLNELLTKHKDALPLIQLSKEINKITRVNYEATQTMKARNIPEATRRSIEKKLSGAADTLIDRFQRQFLEYRRGNDTPKLDGESALDPEHTETRGLIDSLPDKTEKFMGAITDFAKKVGIEAGLIDEPSVPLIKDTELARMSVSERKAIDDYSYPALDEYTRAVEEALGLKSGSLVAIKNKGERSQSMDVVSPAGARGLMQLMPPNIKRYRVSDPDDPVQSIEAAGKIFRDMLRESKGNYAAAFAYYNGGGAARDAVLAGRQPPHPETRKYLKLINQVFPLYGGAYADQ